ncbi:MAG: protein kinase [bacterium]
MEVLLGRYKVLKKLGQGGMGKVFLAKDSVLEREVAIKVMVADLVKKQEFLQRFIREAKITASLDHINIVKIYDLVVSNNQYYLIMEYIDGESLRSYIEKGYNQDFNASMDIFLQILDGIEYAHSKNIVHRDLKPENIMISSNGIVKITDFGLAFAVGSHSITNPGMLMGTLGYLSPEQARGIDVDHRTDIYALGAILYELLTSNLPLVDLNPAGMIYKILNEPPVPPSKYNPSIPPQIEKIIMKCLEKDKNKRYSSVSELKKEVEKFIYQGYEDNYSDANQTSVNQASKPSDVDVNQVNQVISEISSYKKNLPDILYHTDRLYDIKEKVVIDSYSKQSIDSPKSYSPSSSFSVREIEQLLSKAQKEYERKNYEETIKILEIILPHHKSKSILYVLAKSYYKLKDYSKALEYINMYKRNYEENDKILSLEGEILYCLKDYVNSYVSLYRAYDLTGDRYYLLLACRSALNYSPETVVDYLTPVVSVEKDQHILAKSYKYLGLAYYELGNYELAIENLEHYLRMYDDSSVINPLIKSYKMAGKSLQLAKIYSALLEATEDEAVLKDALSFYISTSKYKEAIEICYRLISLNPNDVSIYQDLYLASKSINNPTSLILAIENILKLDKNLPIESKIELMEELLELYDQEQQYEDAMNLINDLIEIAGFKIDYKYKQAELYYKMGSYEMALNILYELVSINSNNPFLYERISEIYRRLGNIEQAIESIKTALQIDPSNYQYYKILSNLYLESNRTEELIKILKNLIDYNPDDIEAYILLSQVYLSMKNYQDAYENILIAYSKANGLNIDIPLKTFDILMYSLSGIFRGTDIVNKFKEIVLEIKNQKYLPYLYFCVGFYYWINGYQINAIEYLNNCAMISKNLNPEIHILASSIVNFIKGKYFESIENLEKNQKKFRESKVNEIKKKYYETILTMYLLTNTYPSNLDSYFGVLGDLYEKYEVYGLFLKGMFVEKLSKNKTDYSNALFLYEKAIQEGYDNEYINFRAFFSSYIIGNYQKAKEYIKKLISYNGSDEVYLYYYKVLGHE